jgi:BirA family biotin operon repressor/biotin-[acetyl-CoA-carboxylase] ligase
MEQLDEQEIRRRLSVPANHALRSLTILSEVDSTNRYLLEEYDLGADGVHGCLAETQTAGRGRRGRTWSSPAGANLYLSLLRTYASVPKCVEGLSLVAGIAVARALKSLDVRAVALKWPNDIQIGGKKLGGILIETSGASVGSWRVVTGVGINIDMPRDGGTSIDQPWTDLARHGAHPGRNRLAARVLGELIMAANQFAESGLETFMGEWQQLDALRGREVALDGAGGTRWGTARGVDSNGALLVEIGGQRERIVCADVSLRLLN